jgi:hypothetical protein
LSVFELFGRIAVDSSGAEKGLNDTVKHAKGAEGKLAATFKKIGGLVAAAFSVRAIVDFGKQCTEAYASIAAEESAFAQIMGDYADTAQAKLNAVSDATGVSATRMTGAMTSLTAKFKGLGYNVADATTLATDGLLIAMDAAAFWDMSLDESMSHLNSFINGSYEGGEAIGLFANDTQMAAYAIEQGIVKDAKAWSKLDEATKQATRLDYAKKMMADSGATGQAAKEADSYANVMANLKESWRQFQGVVGKPILEKLVLPAMQKLNNFLPKLTEGVQNGIVFLEEGFGKIKEYFTDVFTEDGIKWDALPDAMTKMFRDLNTSAGKLLKSFGQTLRKGWSGTVWPMIQKTFKAVFGIELPDWATITKSISDGWNNKVWPAVQGFFSTKFGIELPNWATITKSISDGWNNTVWPAIKGLFMAVFGVETPEWETVKQNISDGWNKTVWPAVQGFFSKRFNITLPSWTELKEKISNSWNKTVWPAIKGFFTKPFSITLPSWAELKEKISNGWSKTVWPAVKGFFKKPFGITLPSWTELKEKISNSWSKTVWPAIKGFFTKPFVVNPEDTDGKTTVQRITDWWNNKVTPSLATLFETTFEVKTEDADGTEVGKKFREWWELAKASIGDIFKATFKIDLADGYAVGEAIRVWWNQTMTAVGDIFKAIFTVTPPDADGTTTALTIKEWWGTVETTIGNIFRGFFGIEPGEDPIVTAQRITAWATSVLKYIGDIFKGFFGIEPEADAQTVANGIVAWWTSVTKELGESLFDFVAGLDLPAVDEIVTAIKNWWADVTKNITLKLPFGLGNLFGNDEPEEGGKDGKDSGVGENGQGDGGKSSGDPKGGKWTPAALGMYDPNWSFGGGKNGTATLPSMLATINSTLSTLPAQVEAAAASGVATGVGNITVTGHVTTGNVMLDGSALVGRLAPRINLALGGSGMLRYNMRNPNP